MPARIDTFLSQNNYYKILLIILAVFVCSWKLGSEPLNEWDESRNGVNAIEMLQSGDYVNLYYGGEPDTWNAKPPMYIWLVTLSYSVFGYNEFALRFPSALAAFISIIITFHLVNRFVNKRIAFFSSFIILTVDGIVGNHVGRTGDFDALLLMFIMLSIWHLLLYTEFNKKISILYCAIFLGFAYLSKGLAVLIIFPGLFLYTIISRKIVQIFSDKMFWLSAVVFVGFIMGWYLIGHLYGLSFETSIYGTKNSFQTMWQYDVLHRFSAGFNDSKSARNLAFFITFLDVKFNLWNYAFYLMIIAFVISAFKRRSIFTPEESHAYSLFLFSFCIISTTGLILSLSAESHFWYMTPAVPFIAILVAAGFEKLSKHYKPTVYVAIILSMVTFTKKIYELSTPHSKPSFISSNQAIIEKADKISVYNMGRQDYLLYLKFNNKNVTISRELTNLGTFPDELLVTNKETYENSPSLKSTTTVHYDTGEVFILRPM